MSDPRNFPFDVFLSHSSKDKGIVRPLAEKLRADGLKVWFDEWVLRPGDGIPAKIEEGLENSRVLVLCMSAQMFESDMELEALKFRFSDPLNRERRLISLRLDDAPIKDFRSQFLHMNWRPSDRQQDRQQVYRKLVEACRTLEQNVEAIVEKWKKGIARRAEEPQRAPTAAELLGDRPFWPFNDDCETLELDGLGLSCVPECVLQLSGLKLLRLEDNCIEQLPEWIGQVTTLRGLDLSRNRLRQLPESIGYLKSLETLMLEQNPLQSLPESLRGMPLKTLALSAPASLSSAPDPATINQLGLPASVLKGSAEIILRYYFESRNEKGKPLLELKLLVVGRGGAGKTTLLKRIIGENINPYETETHSVTIRELKLDCKRGQVRGRVWDFGGQEILHATHQFFLTERSLYLLVLEPRSGLAQQDAEYWLKLIEVRGGRSPTIIATNWSYGRRWRVDEVKLRRKFPFIVGFVPTDALRDVGIEGLRRMIFETVEVRMHDVWLPFPQRWREIKEAVSGMRQNFLTYEQYKNVCSQWGETDPSAQKDLAGILHALGLALYFGDDPRLHDTRVLNPGWVTGGVYAVVRSGTVTDKQGQLVLGDMPQVLREAEQQNVIRMVDYPPASHRFILELMRAFQLCYSSEEEKDKPVRYLVPELLPAFEPEMKDQWESAPVRLRYRYEVMALGLLPRLIVRTHALSDGAPHWRQGVVLRHVDAKALIRAETDFPELQVLVLGADDETRRVLVAIVRRELEKLNAEMRMQPAEELELSGEAKRWIGVKALREVELLERPIQRLPIQPDGTAEVDVPHELDKLVPTEARAIDRDPTAAPIPVRIFVSYAHDDERQLKRLDAILDVLEQQHGLASWRDRRLIAGDEWDEEIRSRLEEMDILLFIASQTSLVRPYIKDPELRRAAERREAGQVEIVTVKLEPCACDDDAFLGKFQRLAARFKSIAEAPLKSAAWEQVRKDLLPVIQRVREKKADER